MVWDGLEVPADKWGDQSRHHQKASFHTVMMKALKKNKQKKRNINVKRNNEHLNKMEVGGI